MNLAQELIRFGQTLADACPWARVVSRMERTLVTSSLDRWMALAALAEENNAADDLWTWLPSYKIAQKYHGDYANEHRPSNKDIMHEAALYLGNSSRADTTMTAEEKEWFTRCPCDEDHTPESSTRP